MVATIIKLCRFLKFSIVLPEQELLSNLKKFFLNSDKPGRCLIEVFSST